MLKFFEIEARFPRYAEEVPQQAVAYVAEQVDVPAAKACVSLRGTGSSDPGYVGKTVRVEMWDADGWDSQVGAPIYYSLGTGYHGYCWSALYTNHEHYFKIVKEWGPSQVWGDGWASAT